MTLLKADAKSNTTRITQVPQDTGWHGTLTRQVSRSPGDEKKKKSVDFCWFLLPIEILKQMACALHRPFAQKNVGGDDREQT